MGNYSREDVTLGWSIPKILQLLGKPAPNAKGWIRCPVHADTNPSCHIVSSGRGWRCFSCEAKGGIFDLIVAYGFAEDEKTAAKFLESVS